MELIIDQEFRNYLPGCPAETDELLEAQLRSTNGPLDAFKVWKGKNILIDGYRRYEICQRLNLPWPTPQEIDLPDREAVKNWMDTYQGSRRNDTDHQKRMRVARMVAYLKRDGKKTGQALVEVAEQENVSPRTVRRDVEYAENLEKVAPEVREKITSNELKATHTDVQAMAEMSPQHQLAVVGMVESGAYSSLTKALHGEEDLADVKNDSVSQPKKRKAYKPAEDYLDGAQKLLGKVRSEVARANEAQSGFKQFETAQRLITNLGVVLAGWQEEVKEGDDGE